MSRCVRSLLVSTISAVMLVGGIAATADASGVARVSGVSQAGQDWYHAKIRVHWKGVAGAAYQLRWASSKARLRSGRPLSATGTSAYAGPLSRGGTSYVQVRAVRSGHAGPWSIPRGVHFTNRWPSQPRLGGVGVPGGVRFTWGYTPYASRYRVMWAAAPFGKWPTTPSYVSGWLPLTARSSTFTVPRVPQPGDHMLGVAYANPVWGRLEASNAYLKGATRLSAGWKPIFPAAPNPGTGDRLRLGTYNVMLSPGPGARVNAIAANIKAHGLDVAALQEANATTGRAVLAALGAGWSLAPSGDTAEQQVLYRTAKYHADASGTFEVPDYKTPATPLITPWVRLRPLTPADPAHSQSFYVVSVHFAQNDSASPMEKKRDAGIDAQQTMRGIAAVNTTGLPVVAAGDLRYLREPFGDVPGYVEAPPTFVRGGYYDAMAAVSKTNFQYATVNGGNGTTSAHQYAFPSGVGTRSDYIMLKGFRGSNAYVNTPNWSYNGIVPSDHNLVYADLTVPFSQ